MDPYNQNTLKGDRPIYGKDWFLNLNIISDSLAEFRRIPTPVGNQAEPPQLGHHRVRSHTLQYG